MNAMMKQAKRDIIAYITQTRVEPNPGGFSLGRTGPVTEGLVIFLGGLGFLVLIALWVIPVLMALRHFGFERRRWADSAFNPYQSGGGGDGDDDSGGDD